ncbi:hypothetical protein ACLOJK_035070, partial [Asimina triloba]
MDLDPRTARGSGRHHAAASRHRVTGPLPHRRSTCDASPWLSLLDRGSDLAAVGVVRPALPAARNARYPPPRVRGGSATMDRDGFDALAIDARCPRHHPAGEDGFRLLDPPR